MHIQRICGQNRLVVTHCAGRSRHLPYYRAKGGLETVKLARVGRSLLETDATGERAVRLSPTAPGPFNFTLLQIATALGSVSSA